MPSAVCSTDVVEASWLALQDAYEYWLLHHSEAGVSASAFSSFAGDRVAGRREVRPRPTGWGALRGRRTRPAGASVRRRSDARTLPA